jgi:LacI family transcriptional regulator
MRDVAQRARVSTATVSRVLSGKATVDPDLRRQVVRAARALGYQPNSAARQLRIRRSPVIGLVLSDVENPFFTSIIGATEGVAFANGYSVIVCDSAGNLDRERRHCEVLSAERVAGVLIATVDERRGHVAIESLIRHGIPVVAFDRSVQHVELDTAVLNNAEAARLATRHLLDDGHTSIGFIGGSRSVITGRDRLLGFEQAHEERGLRVGRSHVRLGDFQFESGHREANAFLDLPKPPTALLVASGLMTLGALTAIQERGLKTPGDVGVIGFDDFPWAVALNPALTTVAQPVHEEGEIAARFLLRRIADPDAPVEKVLLEPVLNVRQSCGRHETDLRGQSSLLDLARIGAASPIAAQEGSHLDGHRVEPDVAERGGWGSLTGDR